MRRRRLAGEPSAWSAGLWPEIRAAYEELPADRRQHFEELATLSRSIAEENRRQRRLQFQGHRAEAVAVAPAAAAPRARPGITVASASDWLNSAGDADPVPRQASEEAVAHVVSQSRDAHERPAPMSEGMFARFQDNLPRGTRAEAGGLRGAASAFTCKLCQVGRPFSHEARFPSEVGYATECGELCRTDFSHARVRVHEQILQSLSQIAAKVASKPVEVCQKRALLYFEVSVERADGDEMKHLWLVLASAHGASGRRKAEQNFIACEVTRDATGGGAGHGFMAGTQLRLKREGFVPHRVALQHPFRGQTFGRLWVATEGALARELVDCVQSSAVADDDGGDFDPPTVLCQRMLYTDISGDEYRVLGCDPEWEAYMVTLVGHVGLRDNVAPQPVPPPSASSDEDGGSGRPQGDMMDIFDIGPSLSAGSGQLEADAQDSREVMDEVARAMGLDPEAADSEEVRQIWEVLHGGGFGDVGDVQSAAEPESVDLSAEDMDADCHEAEAEEEVEKEESAGEEPFVVEELPAEFARRIGLEPAPGWSFVARETGQQLGYIRALPSGRSIKATCRCHNDCTAFKNEFISFGHTVSYLIAWLAAGPAQSAASHMAHVPNLRALSEGS